MKLILQIDRPCEVLDLLANCKIDDSQAPEYAEIKEMGLWHSTPLPNRHKSKISLTWVLKENLENAKLPEIQSEERIKSVIGSDFNRQNQKYVNERYRKCKRVGRVVGRNEYYHNLKFKSACEEFVKGIPDTCSDSSEEYSRKRHKHRHRKKKKPRERFGYDIKDLDSFLTEVSLLNCAPALSLVRCIVFPNKQHLVPAIGQIILPTQRYKARCTVILAERKR